MSAPKHIFQPSHPRHCCLSSYTYVLVHSRPNSAPLLTSLSSPAHYLVRLISLLPCRSQSKRPLKYTAHILFIAFSCSNTCPFSSFTASYIFLALFLNRLRPGRPIHFKILFKILSHPTTPLSIH